MKKVVLVSCLAFICFALGVFTGQRIPIDGETSTATDTSHLAPQPLLTVPDTIIEEPIAQTENSFELILDPDDQGGAIEQTSFETPIQLLPPKVTDIADTEGQIRKYFPELSADEIQGWVDTYKDLSATELDMLLQEKLQLSGITPKSSFLSQDFDFEITEQPQSTIDFALKCVRDNLMNWKTSGYRRTIIRSTPTHDTATADQLDFAQNSRSFTPGKIEESHHCLHMAIEGQPNVMFQLQPGNIFTRLGTFQRLADGFLGLQFPNGKSLRLSDDISVPENVISTVIEDGQITFITDTRKNAEPVSIHLARIAVISELHSENGVIFTLPDDQQQFVESIDAVNVRVGAVETSNVAVEDENTTLQQLERIIEFGDSPLN